MITLSTHTHTPPSESREKLSSEQSNGHKPGCGKNKNLKRGQRWAKFYVLQITGIEEPPSSPILQSPSTTIVLCKIYFLLEISVCPHRSYQVGSILSLSVGSAPCHLWLCVVACLMMVWSQPVVQGIPILVYFFAKLMLVRQRPKQLPLWLSFYHLELRRHSLSA